MHNYTYLWLKADGRLSAQEIAASFADIFIWGMADPSGVESLAAADGEPRAFADT
jgi:hypothetical protein